MICKNVYIAACDKNGGIYRYNIDDGGCLHFVDKTRADSIMYMIIRENTLYAVLKEPFAETKDSGLVSFEINSDGSLSPVDGIIPTKGEEGCHLTADISGNEVYCANYTSGSIFKSDGTTVAHRGEGPNKERQEAAHTHYIEFTPDGKYLCVVDLGIDKIIVYDKILKPVSECSLLPGSGPRHLAFAPDGRTAYCINELSNTVSILEYFEGNFTYINSVDTLPEGHTGESTSAAIRISEDGRYLYTSNRGHDLISCFETGHHTLELFDAVPCGGQCPRDFNISPDGKWLVCTNEVSDNVTVFQIGENGKLVKTDCVQGLRAPLCVAFG